MKKWKYGLAAMAIAGIITIIPMGVNAAGTEVTIDETNFPDAIFREYVADNFDTDENGSLSEEEIAEVTAISINGAKGSDEDGVFLGKVSDLTGIQFFTNLERLYCSDNAISRLDVSNNLNLSRLACAGNEMVELVVGRNEYLVPVIMGDNWRDDEGILTIKGHHGGVYLRVDYYTEIIYDEVAPFVEINGTIFPDSAFREYVSTKCDTNGDGILIASEYMAVKEIDVGIHPEGWKGEPVSNLTGISVFPNLEILNCLDNNVKSLDTSENPSLKEIDCSFNKITALELSNNAALEILSCSGNQISRLDLSNNTFLKKLYCDRNELTDLDVSSCKELQNLDCFLNPLVDLRVSFNEKLTWLQCFGCYLDELDIGENPFLAEAIDQGTEKQYKEVIDEYGEISYIGYEKDIWTSNERFLSLDRSTKIIRPGQDDTDAGWQEIDGKKYYYENGTAVTGAKMIQGRYYYFDNTGVMQTGVLKAKGHIYYLDPETGAMHTGWLTLGKKKYYFDANGVMQTGVVTIYRKKYYFNSDGTLRTGVLKTSKGIFYLDPDDNGAMHTGWLNYKGKRYYFGENGKMVTGVLKLDGKTYYLNKKGQMQTGVLKAKGKIYYLDPGSGEMHIGLLWLKDQYYYMQEDGSLAVNCVMEIRGRTCTIDEKGVVTFPNESEWEPVIWE